MATTLADRLKEQRRRHFVGRSREKDLLEEVLQAKEWLLENGEHTGALPGKVLRNTYYHAHHA